MMQSEELKEGVRILGATRKIDRVLRNVYNGGLKGVRVTNP